MEIKILKGVGERLLKEIPLIKKATKTAIGIGSSGDKTYSIDKLAEDIILTNIHIETCKPEPFKFLVNNVTDKISQQRG